MPYYHHQGRIYFVEEVPWVPNGYRAEPVPVSPPASPAPPPGLSQLDLAVEKLRREIAETNLNTLRNRQRAEAEAQARAKASAGSTQPPQRPEPKVPVDSVIDPYVGRIR